jgi:hypothetical protein
LSDAFVTIGYFSTQRPLILVEIASEAPVLGLFHMGDEPQPELSKDLLTMFFYK